jgi:glucose-6-phosphate dehydrogenase assembly protein OpcA
VINNVSDSAQTVPLNAELRLGGDAGASEVIILNASDKIVNDTQALINGLLLPDAPMVAWWPDAAPPRMSETSLGRVAGHRIADTINSSNPIELLRILAEAY